MLISMCVLLLRVRSINPQTQGSPGADLILESLKEKALSLGQDKASLEGKLANTVDNYEAQLALQHKTLTTQQREEISVSSRSRNFLIRQIEPHLKTKTHNPYLLFRV